jgi:hypothetical protein
VPSVVPFQALAHLYPDVGGMLSLFGFDHAGPPPGCPVWTDGKPHRLPMALGRYWAPETDGPAAFAAGP